MLGAVIAGVAGMGWLALAMDVHWQQVRGQAPSRNAVLRLRGLGVFGLIVALVLCLRTDHASMAALVWVMVLTAGALAVTLTLAWRPHWLRVLAWVA